MHTLTVEHYSAIRKNEILPFAMTWLELEGIMLNEIRQRERETQNPKQAPAASVLSAQSAMRGSNSQTTRS